LLRDYLSVNRAAGERQRGFGLGQSRQKAGRPCAAGVRIVVGAYGHRFLALPEYRAGAWWQDEAGARFYAQP
jgi:hypothetical protein